MFPKKGRKFRESKVAPSQLYASAIADALRTELGQTHRASKTLQIWTGASNKTAKNWLSGTCGPSGEHLVHLVRESDIVLATLLGLSDRNRHLVGAHLLTIHRALAAAIRLVEELMDAEPTGSGESHTRL